ncbi:MAG: hypothetical protein A3A51_04720 [Candidatus Levybacteria bacterium RIFCSPLOWO2_01_FULL_39_10]|nr:MAG: hypothetical protein A3A51_04720 [Candidatus Levybacteria bacterium RIFCSPLOWO2_01_FULL_39_10]
MDLSLSGLFALISLLLIYTVVTDRGIKALLQARDHCVKMSKRWRSLGDAEMAEFFTRISASYSSLARHVLILNGFALVAGILSMVLAIDYFMKWLS